MAEGVGEPISPDYCIGLAADIVTAYVSNNSVTSDAVPELIRTVHASLRELVDYPNGFEPEPAVSVESSVGEDFLVCLEDGRKFKSLKRHLRTKYDMTPEEYRSKWNLPEDYPMVAPGYSRQRSQLAKDMGLGRSEKE